MTLQTPMIFGNAEGEHWHFLNTLQTLKVDGDNTDGAFTALEFTGPRGFGPPLHSHDVEDELFYVLEGEVRFTTGDIEEVVTQGGTVFLPKQRAHQFQVLSDTAGVAEVCAQFQIQVLGPPPPPLD